MQNSYDGCNLVARLGDTASLLRLLYCFPTGIKQNFVFVVQVPTIETAYVFSRAGISFQLLRFSCFVIIYSCRYSTIILNIEFYPF